MMICCYIVISKRGWDRMDVTRGGAGGGGRSGGRPGAVREQAGDDRIGLKVEYWMGGAMMRSRGRPGAGREQAGSRPGAGREQAGGGPGAGRR